MGRQIVWYSVLWLANDQTLRTTVLSSFLSITSHLWALSLPRIFHTHLSLSLSLSHTHSLSPSHSLSIYIYTHTLSLSYSLYIYTYTHTHTHTHTHHLQSFTLVKNFIFCVHIFYVKAFDFFPNKLDAEVKILSIFPHFFPHSCQSYKLNFVLERSKLVLNSLTVHYFNFDFTSLIL